MKQAIYTCYPYRNNPAENTEAMIKVSAKLWFMGYVPVCPHLSTQFFDQQDVKALDYCIELLKKCDVLLICSNHVSSGMKTEIAWWSKYRKGKAIKFWDMQSMDFQTLEGGQHEEVGLAR